MIRRLAWFATGVAAALGFVACGADGPSVGEPAANDSSVTVVAADIKLTDSTYHASAGPVAITYRNDGSIEHTLVIEGVDGFRLDVPKHGDTEQATTNLQSGEYTIYCDIPGHREAGMHATLTVA